MEGLTASGLGSGLDIKALVDQLVAAERQAPNDRLNLAEARVNREISSIGKIKSALAGLKDVLEKLSDPAKFQVRKVSVAEEALLSVSADSEAAPASYSIDIQSLASRQKIASSAFADAATAIGYGTLSISVGGAAFNVEISEEANTLADIRDAINSATTNTGVVASIVVADDGARLVLTGRETGSSNTFSVTSSGGDGGLAAFDYAIGTPGSYTEIAAAADAVVIVDGFTVTSASNTVTGAIEGVTLTLLKADPGNAFEFDVALDKDASKVTLSELIGAYNGVATAIAKETEYDAEAGLSGALLGDSTVRGIQDALRRGLSSIVGDSSSAYRTLAEIGVVTTAKGRLDLKSDRLDAAFASDFDGIGRLLAGEDGIASRLLERVEAYLASDGQIEGREDRLRGRLDDLKEDRERLEQRLEAVRKRYQLQFNAMDLFVSQLNTTSQFLAQQLG
jgi:flagellar hook-associated protein 2